jgi:acetyl-CoA synthetase
MLRTIWGDDQRYVDTYFTKWAGRPDLYFPATAPSATPTATYWIMGRVDDVLNVAGHRIGTMEWRARWWTIRPWPRPPWWARRTT